MSGAAGFDIRVPLGWLFVVLGLMLAVWGLISGHEIYERSLGLNVNLGWGIVLVIFGAICLMLARRAAAHHKTVPPNTTRTDGGA